MLLILLFSHPQSCGMHHCVQVAKSLGESHCVLLSRLNSPSMLDFEASSAPGGTGLFPVAYQALCTTCLVPGKNVANFR